MSSSGIGKPELEQNSSIFIQYLSVLERLRDRAEHQRISCEGIPITGIIRVGIEQGHVVNVSDEQKIGNAVRTKKSVVDGSTKGRRSDEGNRGAEAHIVLSPSDGNTS